MERYISEIIKLLSVLFLVSVFFLVSNKRPITYIRSFRMQSLILALIMGIASIYKTYSEKVFEPMLITFVLTIVLKVFIIPRMLEKVRSGIIYRVEKDFFINIPMSIIICMALFILSWYASTLIPVFSAVEQKLFFAIALSTTMIGLFFMTSRKKAVGQVIGFLTIENGIFLGATVLAMGMPMIVELGVFFNILTAVIVMGSFVYKISNTFEHIDVNKMKKLKG